MSTLPPLPKIDGDVDLMLDVYTHSSLRSPGVSMNENYGDTQRLEDLGAKVFDLAVTVHLYNERPVMNSAEEMRSKRIQFTSFATIDSWLDSYGLKKKLRIAPSEINAIVTDPVEMTKYFHIYVGAAYICNGQDIVQNWISRLIDPNADVSMTSAPPRADVYVHPPRYQSPAYSQPQYAQPQYSQPQYGHANTYSTPPRQPYFSPSQPSSPPPPLPSNPMPSVGISLVNLALVNQTAAQKGIHVSYPAEQVGPSHQPTWTVRCCMNGEEKGIGVGKSQKIAKEDAAKQAWVAMGWGS